MANEKLTFDLLVNSSNASTGFAAAGRAAAAASDDVQALTKRLDEVGKKSVKARVGLDGDKDADLSLDKLQLRLLKLGKTVARPNVTVDGLLRATVEAKGLELELDKLNAKASSISGSGSGLSKLGALLSFGGAAGGSAGQGGGGIFGGLSDALGSPAGIAATIGVAVTAGSALLVEVDGLVSGFAAAGAGLGAFGLLALPTFKNIAAAYTGISAAQQKYQAALAAEKQDPTKANAAAVTRALDALKVAQDNLSPSTKTAVGGIQALDTEYHKMVTAFAPDAMKVFNDGLHIANELLPLVTPFATTAGSALDGLLRKAQTFFARADFKGWLGSFEKDVGPALTAIGVGLGKTGVAAGKLFTVMSPKDIVMAINIGFATIDTILNTTRGFIGDTMWAWDRTVQDVKDSVHAFELVRDETDVVWGHMEEDVLHMALSITNTMGKLPGPLGAPFRAAHTDISHELTSIEADVAAAEARITSDWKKLHGIAANITVRADGTFKVGTTGPVARAAGGLITGGTPGRDSVLAALMPGEVVVPTRMVSAGAVDHLRGQLPGFASGGVVGSYSGAVPGLAPWMGRQETATQAMLEKLTAAAAAAAMKALASAGAASGPGGGAPSANAALAQRLYASQLTPSVWAAWNAVAMRESGWSQFARNASSGAYGIPQALPPTKMPFAAQAAGGSNPTAQIRWMWDYMAGRYGGPIGAEQHEQSAGWYDRGGYLPPGLSVAYNGTGRAEAVTTQADMKAMVDELRAMHASMVVMHKGIVGAVAKVAPGVNHGLNSAARGVITR